MQQCHTPRLVAVTKFKTTKINFEGLFGLSTKIRPHENCPPYGINFITCCILYFLEISPRRDLISSRCTLWRNFEGGEISRAATSPLTCLTPAHSFISIVQIVRVRLHSAYFESDDPFPCGEISRAAFIGTNLLIGAARFQGNTVLLFTCIHQIQYKGDKKVFPTSKQFSMIYRFHYHSATYEAG